jgi:glutaminase-like protein
MPQTTKTESAVVSLAAIRTPRRGETEYLFFERQQIFTVRATAARRAESANLLRRALREKQPLTVVLDPRRGEIQRIATPTPKELEQFNRGKIAPDVRGTVRKIDLARLDPSTFNVVDLSLKVPIFRLCKKTMPNYKTAKKIFDFCAKQSCHLGGPFDITPCIPFQYVIDGCYARAHKMRQIITARYRYCCEKVFSFANSGNDTLAVKADKWGGCCVFWWYHVAPLVRVRIKLGRFRITLAMVIDPGMFDKPVLLSTWLAAQANKTCSPDANVSMYSIQPGSAYWPTSFSGTTFGTDPNYSLTNGTLISYQNLITCP